MGMQNLTFVSLTIAICWYSSLALAADTPASNSQIGFSEAFAQCPTVLPGDDGYRGAILEKNILKDTLTAGELRLLSLFIIEEGYPVGCGLTLPRVIANYRKTGKLAIDGMDLYNQDQGGNAGEKNPNEQFELSNTDQLKKFGMYLNPATGQFYESFASSEWHQFGVFIEKVDGDGGLKVMPLTTTTEGTPQTDFVAHRAYRIVVFGENQDTILVDKHIWFIESQVDDY